MGKLRFAKTQMATPTLFKSANGKTQVCKNVNGRTYSSQIRKWKTLRFAKAQMTKLTFANPQMGNARICKNAYGSTHFSKSRNGKT